MARDTDKYWLALGTYDRLGTDTEIQEKLILRSHLSGTIVTESDNNQSMICPCFLSAEKRDSTSFEYE